MNKIKIPKIYDGISTIDANNKGRDYVLIENVPGGCPDYNLRDFWIGIRDKKYLVVMLGNIKKEFSELEIYAVYDLVNDKEELHNLNKIIDKENIKKELDIIQKEFDNLKKDMKKNNFL